MGRLVLGVAAATLVGCGGGGPAPIAKDRMLVLGSATGPVYEALRSRFKEIRVSSPPSDFRGYRLVVVDGTSSMPGDARSLGFARNALGAGVSVLMVNARQEHKSALLSAKLIPAAPRGPSDGILITPLAGARRYHLANLRPAQVRNRKTENERDPSGVLSGSYAEASKLTESTPDRIAAFLDIVESQTDGANRAAPVAPTPPSDYPTSSWFQVSLTETLSPSQVAGQFSSTTTFHLYGYFDSGSSFTNRWFQWLAIAADGLVTPSPPVQDQVDNRGPMAVWYALNLNPDNTNGNGLQLFLVDAQPTSSANSLSSSLEFNIGYRGQSGNTAWLWQQGLSQTTGSFNGWLATAPPPSSNDINAVTLSYMQTSPFDGDLSNWENAYYKVFVGAHIEPINGSSRNPMEIVGQSLWRTQQVFDGVVTMILDTNVHLCELSVTNYFFTWKPHLVAWGWYISNGIDVDLGQLTAP